MSIEIAKGVALPIQDVVKRIQKDNDLSNEEAMKISFILSEIQDGYTLSIYPSKNLDDMVQLCHITYDGKRPSEQYIVVVEDLTINTMLSKNTKKHVEFVTLPQIVQILLNVCPNNQLSFSMDFDWENLEVSLIS